MEAQQHHVPSPGNAYSPPGTEMPAMRMPHLEFVYRIVAEMDSEGITEIPNVDGTSVTRIVLPIQGGRFSGPRVQGVIVERSGADWAEIIHPKKAFWKLHATYTLRTNDNFHILVHASGIFRNGPGVSDEMATKETVSQDEAEYFTHIRLEAPGGSPYGWMNGIVAVGVMTMWEGKPVIDCYRMTNFPGKAAAEL
ncbi:hypothetical protein QQZ08_005741 [Neonectria magnoliae]|uniref:Uncharacterized protein n=1 Tax=Neonectria magnoliae TaxID=2732573 RepID=A0ABR1I4G4_9HYPO